MLSDGKNTVQAKQWFNKCYSDSALSETTVTRWYVDFKRDLTGTNDAERSGRPNSAVVLENFFKKLHKLVLANCKLQLHEIAEEVKILEVGAAFGHSRSKTTTRRRFRAMFATVSTQQKGDFA